jgi:hypothetical protein
MSEYVKFATTTTDQYLTSLAEAQDAFLKSMTPYSEWASTVPQMPSAKFAPEMPTMAEITEAHFAFASKLLKQQKKFAEKLFATATPES